MKRTFNILKRISVFVLTFIFIVIAFGSFITFDNPKKPNKVTLSADTWNSELVEIENMTSTNTNNYIDIHNFITIDKDGLVTGATNVNQITDSTIIRINDGLDLYYFAELCNPTFANGTVNNSYQTFLKGHYHLENNINYENASMTFKMLRPIGWSGIPFSGIFDGTGHTISNIFYRPLEDSAEALEYPGLTHVALFSANSGEIKNVGIVNANMIQYDLYEGFFSVSPFVGENLSGGLVENCFVQDLRGNDAGFSAEGGYHTSMFAVINNGTMRNCYVAVDRITSPTISATGIQARHPFVYQNNGTLDRCYYDAEILTNTTTYTQTEYDGLTALKTAEFLDINKFLHFDPETNDQIWYSNATYRAEYSSYLKLKYPILRGFEVTTLNNVEYFMIENVNDLVLMSEYIENYQAFRTASYVLTNSVDLNTVSPNAFKFTEAVFSGKLIGAAQGNDGYSVHLADGSISNNPAIINLKIDKGNSYNGYRCYGFFSVLAGTVEGIDFVNVTINQSDIATVNLAEINTVGVVCGLLEGGSINDVNVDVDITLTNTNNNQSVFLGSQNVGGICGTATKGTITNSTTTGIVNHVNYTNVPTGNYSHSIGGILGKAENNDGVINCLNNIEINNISYSNNPTNYKQYIGGVIGSGHINNTYQLQNNNIINVDNGTYYSLTYVGGVVGLVVEATNSNGIYLNNADINFDVDNNNYKAYISGVMNVISETALEYDTFNATGLNYNTVQTALNDQKPFEFTSLSNAGLLNITNSLSTSKAPAKYSIINNLTVNNGIDIRCAGVAYSYLTNMNVLGAYNLNYKYVRNGQKFDKPANNPQEIDVSMIDEYGPTFNADNKVSFENNELGLDTNYLSIKTALQTTINLERVYNYAQINYVTKKDVLSYMMQLSGCVNGRNFNLKNIRNDGDIRVYFEHDSSSISLTANTYQTHFRDHKKLKVFGVMEEVSLGHTAEDIYNGGNITVSSNSNTIIYFNLYMSGICYKNVGNDDTSTQKLLFDRGYQGSLHNCVNNGTLRTTNGDIRNNNDLTTPGRIYGYSRSGGITCINSSTISQTFNLGDIYNVVQLQRYNSTYGGPGENHFEVETGGICYIMQNEIYDAQNHLTSGNIIDSANNGTVIAMNTSTDSEIGNGNGFTNAGGFVARNDRSEDGYRVDEQSSNSATSHLSKIQYSINYGDVYAYNKIQNVKYGGEQQSKAAGFVCLGACTIVDTVNYGNIYGNSVAAGMFGYLYISRMRTAGLATNSPIYIANSINYGKVKVLRMSNTNENLIPTVKPGSTPDYNETPPTTGNTNNNTVIYCAGALIGVWAKRSNDDDLNCIKVKYLVNFQDTLNILGRASDANYDDSNAVINAKHDMLLNMATTNPNDTSESPFNTNRQNYNYGIKSYRKDASAGTHTGANIFSQEYNGGIFNENYSLRTPGELTYDAQGNIDTNNTDNFIADYIQFVPYSKVNDYLVEKIGLKEAVEQNAYSNALTNVELIKQVLLAKNPGSLDSVYNELLAQNQAIVEAEKYDIANAIKKYLDTNPDKADDIAKVLIEDKVAVQQVLSSTDVQNILSDLIENLSEDAMETYLINIINEYGLDEYLNEPSNLDVMGQIINAYANQDDLTDAQRNLVLNLFDLLSQNNNALEAYGESLTDAEKNTISNSIYNLVQNNQGVLDAISNTYFEELAVNNADFNTLKTQIINNRINNNLSNLYPISDDEYIQMYNNIYYSSYTNQQVQQAINNLNNNNLRTLVNNIVTAVGNNTSNKMYEFLDSGRSNTNNLYLPATATNYVAIINTTNFAYVSSEGTIGTNQAYTGTNQGTGNNPNNLVEIYVENQANYYPLEFSGNSMWGGAQTSNGAVYWRLENGDFSTFGANNDDRNYYKVSISTGSSVNNDFITHEMPHTGVFATAQAANAEFSSGNNWFATTYQIGSYQFNDVDYFTYINYGSGAIAKNGGNLTLEMVNQLNTLVQTNANATTIKNYLYNIYVNSQVNKTEFLKLLFNPQAVTINNALTYLNNNLTADNMEVALLGITNSTARANIVKLLNNNNKGYGEIVPEMVKALDSANNYEQVKAIIGGLVSGGYSAYNGNKTSTETAITNMLYSNGALWDGLTYEQKEAIVLYYFEITDLGLNLLTEAVNNGNLSEDEYQDLVYQLMLVDPYNLYTYRNDLKDHLSDEVKAEIGAIIISNSESLFTKYTGLTNANIVEELEKLGVDSSVVTDFTGIYALASSMGIEAGLFLPDNISLIELDKYHTNEAGVLVNDPTWRGGTYENPNSYNENERTVNSKIYHEMKQLKKSIATIIFKMELTDEAGENVIDNNIEYDYKCNYKEKDNEGKPIVDANGNHIITNEVRFYIPINHDILKKEYLVANMEKGSYELSYEASFDEDTNKLEIEIPNNIAVGDVLEDTFVIQAEDTNVKTTYTIYVTITNPAYLNPLTSVVVDGVNSNLFTSTATGDRQEVITNAVVTTAVVGYNGRIVLNYGTINMINGLDLLSNVKVYKADATTLPAAAVTDFTTYMSTELTNGTDYHFNDVTNNGIVVINNVTGTGFNDNSYPAGTVFFDISIDNMQTKGIYLVEIEINEGAKYYVLFEKAASNNSSLESLTYDDEVFNNDLNNPTNSNAGSVHKHKFGTPLTADDLADASYLSNIVVAPHAKYQVTNVSCNSVNGKIEYQVVFTITAEDGSSSTFTHYITEEDYVTYINRVYLDGGIIEDEPLGDDEIIPDDSYIFEAEFEKTEAPSYRFEYPLSSFYTYEGSQYFKVQFYDEDGGEIDTPAGVNVTVTEGLDFEIEFSSDAESMDYYFAMIYEHKVAFNDTITNSWEVKFDTIHIKKFKSRNSYLDNITFFSESVTASIRTMIDIDEILLDSYQKMLSDPTRKIVCLPGQIYYNKYAYDAPKIDDGAGGIGGKQEDFYIIGLVNKTALDYYTPDFVVAEGAKIYRTHTDENGVVFRYTPFYENDLQSLTTFLISEDGSQYLVETVDENGEHTYESANATFDGTKFTYNGTEYNISPVAGYPSIEYNDGTNTVVIENTTLRTDYNMHGSYKEELGKFLFVNYRVYAEIYDELDTDAEKAEHVTDYKIAAQDLTNNIKFDITIETEEGCDISDELYNIYLELICNALPDGKEDKEENYVFYNKAGMFAYFVEGSNILTHGTLKSNTSGYYELSVLLPEGYSVTFKVTDKDSVTNHVNGDKFYIAPSVTARTIKLHIIIHEASDVKDDWGVHVKDESFAK
ncbi:MAG: hypothetical protein IKT40_10720 [Bacilli bacterium]|nr:hypothetical protein [Bacilli bacterium]